MDKLLRIGIIGLALIASSLSPVGAADFDEPFARVDRMNQDLNGSCRYPILERNRRDQETMCILDSLRRRCNKIDDCYVYCIGNDVGIGIGGGCAHLCNYALRTKWEPPRDIQVCRPK